MDSERWQDVPGTQPVETEAGKVYEISATLRGGALLRLVNADTGDVIFELAAWSPTDPFRTFMTSKGERVRLQLNLPNDTPAAAVSGIHIAEHSRST